MALISSISFFPVITSISAIGIASDVLNHSLWPRYNRKNIGMVMYYISGVSCAPSCRGEWIWSHSSKETCPAPLRKHLKSVRDC